MAKIVGQKRTKAEDVESAKAKRGPSMGQLLVAPNSLNAREEAKRVLQEALDAGVDGREEQTALEFVKTIDQDYPSKYQVDRYQELAAKDSPMAREARCLECQGFHPGGASCAPAPVKRSAPPVAGYVVEFQGHKVRCGATFITEAQAKWIVDILVKRETSGADQAFIRLEQGLAKFAGSQFITKYKNAPLKPVQVAQSASYAEAVAPGASTEELVADAVPAGRYALRTAGVVKFYRLDRPTEGRWAGYTFLKAQGSDETYPIRNRAHKEAILAEIAKDVLAAEQLYGQELGKCSRCGRTLTDETSRAYGIGPDCRNK